MKMRPMLSILIPTIKNRRAMCRKLCEELRHQADELPHPNEIEIIISDEDEVTIGKKRNNLMKESTGKYIAFIDDDDWIADNYILKVWAGCHRNTDCCSLIGQITIDGGPPEIFEHSTKYSKWRTNEGAIYPEVKYERPPNHLNAIRRDIALMIQFPEINHGEDHIWSQTLCNRALIKSEYLIDNIIYHYNYLSRK